MANSNPQTSWRRNRWQLFAGVFFLFMSFTFLAQVTRDSPHDPDGAQVRRLEAVLGETGAELLFSAVFLFIGVALICTSRKPYVTNAEDNSARAQFLRGCDLCGTGGSDVATAFISIGGGFQPFPAFSCFACERCANSVDRVWRLSMLEIGMLILGMPFVLIAVLIDVGSLFNFQEIDRGALQFLAVSNGLVLALCLGVWALHRHIQHRTCVVLSAKVDSVVRKTTGIGKWGWPLRVVLQRQVEAGQLVLSISSLESK